VKGGKPGTLRCGSVLANNLKVVNLSRCRNAIGAKGCLMRALAQRRKISLFFTPARFSFSSTSRIAGSQTGAKQETVGSSKAMVTFQPGLAN
jgi:hypothetical protein